MMRLPSTKRLEDDIAQMQGAMNVNHVSDIMYKVQRTSSAAIHHVVRTSAPQLKVIIQRLVYRFRDAD